MLRRKTGMTQGEMAECLNTSVGSVGRWESGDKLPSVECLVRIAKFFGIPIDDLLYDEMHEN
jgi:DNA-binding XRE family transcriptional regulator